MTTYGGLRCWKTESLDEAVRSLNRTEAELFWFFTDLMKIRSVPDWDSENADHATRTTSDLLNEIERMLAAVRFARKGVVELGDRVADLVADVQNINATVKKHGWYIDDLGRVGPEAPSGGDRMLASELESRAREAVKKADDIGEDFRVCLGRASAMTCDGELDRRLIAEFQVPVDRRDPGSLSAVADLFGLTDEGKPITRGEADAAAKFIRDHPSAVYHIPEIMKHAKDTAAEQYGNVGATDGATDAFRHAYWNAVMARELGDDFATEFATAHEQTDGSPAAHAMDLHNNEVGRQIAANHPNASRAELEQLVAQAVKEGKLVMMDETGKLVRTDGSTRDPDLPGVDRPGKR